MFKKVFNLPLPCRSLRRSALSTAVLASMTLGLSACQESGLQQVQYQAHDYGGNEPTVISSRPGHDRTVLAEGDRQLDGADYRQLQKQGPNPIWDRKGN